ncbi:phosphodiester glycosidase family protein [Prosthecobacter sp.]|uniref:phosphodiester glycosidase family protein n=1 Tax=Prosthecobacter sp. TaxID=1965333 RepID=UPI003784396A
MNRLILPSLAALLFCHPLPAQVPEPVKAAAEWRGLAKGVQLARFAVQDAGPHEFVIVRIDPKVAGLQLLTAAGQKHDALTADEWAKKHGLSVVINAGMFEPDHVTHTGLMKDRESGITGKLKGLYSSFAMFAPEDSKEAVFRIFDADTEQDMAGLQETTFPKYRCLLQNLRLIKRPGENRWKPQPKAWSEAALGEDREGCALLIFCGAGLAMHDFNERVLKLPIGLVAAQHLEGGPEASLHIKCGGFELKCVGSYETGFNENYDNKDYWPIPNVIGVKSGE